MNTLGIDIGGTAVKVALRDQTEFVTGISSEYARPTRELLDRMIREAIELLPNDRMKTVQRVGLCVPGRRAPDNQSIELAVNVPGLVGYPFQEIVANAIGHSAQIELLGDAEAATQDATACCPGARRVLGIAIGTGVGIALIEDGQSIGIGSDGIGHFGQIDVGPIGDGSTLGSKVGPDGGRNSLEAYLGLPALQARFGAALPERIAALPNDDPAIIAMSRAIRIGLAVYAPDAVFILGGLGLAIAPLSSQIDAMVRDDLTSAAPRSWRLGFGVSRFHAARGAASAAGVSMRSE
ncbi:MAG: ROK family protein [Phycisphaerales bacterium]